MSDKPKRWPYVMASYRDNAADAAVAGIRALEPVVDGSVICETERLRREAKALQALTRIAYYLKAAGAPIREIES